MKYVIAAAAALAVVIGSAAAPALAAQPHRHRGTVLCSWSGRGPCVTVRSWHHRAPVAEGRGTRLRVVTVGRVTQTWPFHRRYLDKAMRGLRVVEFRAGRWCASGTYAVVRLVRCTALPEWVAGFAPRAWVSVRASDARGLPCALTAGTDRHHVVVSAVLASPWQQWRQPG